MAILLDSGFLVLLADKGAKDHQWATEALDATTDDVWTTEAVLTEAAAALAELGGRAAFGLVLKLVEDDTIKIFRPLEADTGTVGRLLARNAGRQFTFATAGLVAAVDALPRATVYTTAAELFKSLRTLARDVVPHVAPHVAPTDD